MFGRRAAFVPIPIGDRHCFTQRFSPTGFILNASKSRCSRPIVLRRIQVKTYPFNSILVKNMANSGRTDYCRILLISWVC